MSLPPLLSLAWKRSKKVVQFQALTNSFFEKLWQNVVLMRKINVPRGCPNILGALDLAAIMCKRLKKPGRPFTIELEEGELDLRRPECGAASANEKKVQACGVVRLDRGAPGGGPRA